MEDVETSKLVKGALLLTVAGLISKILSAGYRIPLQNLTGDHGFYVYQQVYPILGMVMILSLYGFPSAISKITAEMEADGKKLTFKQFYLPVWFILLGVNGLFFSLLFTNAGTISNLIGDKNLMNAYRLTAFTFLFIPFTSLLRGVFQGHSYMKPTAYSQVGEQVFRVFIIILTAYFFMIGKINVYKIGEAGALASMVGATVAIIILMVFFRSDKRSDDNYSNVPWSYYFRTIFSLGIVASLNHMVLLIIQFADVFTLVPSLLDYGLSANDAMRSKGVFDRGQPLIQIGTVIGSSFALAFIPGISKKSTQKDSIDFYEYIQRALSVSVYLSIAAVIGLILIFPETNKLLFQDLNGTFSLQILSITILLSSLAITLSSILQGLGYFKQTAVFILITFIIKWFLNQLLVPYMGITGGAIATVLSMTILCALILVQFKIVLPRFRISEVIDWKALFIACIGLFIYIKAIHFLFPYTLIHSRYLLLIYVLFISLSGAFIYIFSLLRCKVFSEKELQMFPFLSFFIRLSKGRD